MELQKRLTELKVAHESEQRTLREKNAKEFESRAKEFFLQVFGEGYSKPITEGEVFEIEGISFKFVSTPYHWGELMFLNKCECGSETWEVIYDLKSLAVRNGAKCSKCLYPNQPVASPETTEQMLIGNLKTLIYEMIPQNY